MKYVILLIGVLFLFSLHFDANAQNHEKPNIQKNIHHKDVPAGNEAKIDSDIRKLIKEENSRLTRTPFDSTDLARFNQVSPSDKIEVYVYLDSKIDNLPNNIPVISRADDIVFTKLSANQINSLASLDNVKRIGLPIKAVFYGHDISEGVDFSFANLMHSAGYDGSGITVAVIDSGFITSNSEISSNIVGSWKAPGCADMACGDADGNSHGTAVAEIVVDMAPNVNLRVYAIQNTVDFSNAIDDAIANDVDIITASLGFPGAGGDGVTGMFRDGTSSVAKKVNVAKNDGILVTIASGNQAKSHWSGTYSGLTPAQLGISSSYQSYMNFRPSESGLQRICLPLTDVGASYFVAWNDWDVSNQDYDIFLYDSSLDTLLDSSLDSQTGIQPPLEVLLPAIVSPSSACLVLASWSSTQNHFFHINTEDNTLDASVRVRSGSIDTPGDATGSLTVGAINQNTNVLEDFSSSGPTDDSRLKPEICGPDNVLSHQSSINPFFGTSAATPHIAGAAALLLEQNSSLTVDQLRSKLISDARFDASYSVDNLCGSSSGAVSLEEASTECPSVPVSGTWIIEHDCQLTSNVTVPGSVLIQNNSVLTIPSGTTLDIDFATQNLIVKSGSGVLIKSGGKIT